MHLAAACFLKERLIVRQPSGRPRLIRGPLGGHEGALVFRAALLIASLGTVSGACALAVAPGPAAHWSLPNKTAEDSTGRCDYALEGALGLGAGVVILSIIRDRPAEQLAVMVPIGAGLGWLWGRYLMPRRPQCRPPSQDTEVPDSTSASRENGLPVFRRRLAIMLYRTGACDEENEDISELR